MGRCSSRSLATAHGYRMELFTPLILGVLAIAVPLGWLYGWILVPLRADAPSSQIAHSSIAFPDFVFVVPVALACAGVLVGFVWVGALWTNVRIRNTLAAVSLGFLALAALWLVVVVVAPITLEWIRQTFEAVHTPSIPTTASTSGAGSAAAASASTAAATLLLSTLTALFGARAVHTADSWWDQLSSDQRSQLLKKAWHLVLNYRTPLLNFIALLIGPATILALLVFGMDIGALYPAGVGHGTYAPLPALCFARRDSDPRSPLALRRPERLVAASLLSRASEQCLLSPPVQTVRHVVVADRDHRRRRPSRRSSSSL